MNKLMEDSKGEKSLTAGMLKITFAIALVKVLLSDLQIKGINFGEFSAADFGTMLAPMVTLYWSRRNMQFGKSEENKNV